MQSQEQPKIKKIIAVNLMTWINGRTGNPYFAARTTITDTQTGEEKRLSTAYEYGGRSHAEHTALKKALEALGFPEDRRIGVYNTAKNEGFWFQFSYQTGTKRETVAFGKWGE